MNLLCNLVAIFYVNQHNHKFAHKTHSEQTFTNWWKLDLEKFMFENVLFLKKWPDRDFFKKVARANSESFASIFNWGWLFPGRFVTKNRFQESVVFFVKNQGKSRIEHSSINFQHNIA